MEPLPNEFVFESMFLVFIGPRLLIFLFYEWDSFNYESIDIDALLHWLL